MYNLDFLKIVKLLASQGFYSDSLFFSRAERIELGLEAFVNLTFQSATNPRMRKTFLYPSDFIFQAEQIVSQFVMACDDNRTLKRWIQDQLKTKKYNIRVYGTEEANHFEFAKQIDEINLDEIHFIQSLASAAKHAFTWGLRLQSWSRK